MSVLDELKPVRKFLVMNLLEQTGFDVSQWKNYRGASPSANPKYCYNWSFEQPGEVVAVCLWHRSLKERNGTVVFRRKPRAHASVRKEPGASVWNRRDADFGKNLELAYRQQLPIRVIVVEGKQRNPIDLKPKASIVKARLLDPTPWAVTEYDYGTRECLLVRGTKPVVPAVDSSDLELSWFEGKWKRAFAYHRRREAKLRREKIQEALRNNGGKLICEVQNCQAVRRSRKGLRPGSPPTASQQVPEGRSRNKAQGPGSGVCELPHHDTCGREMSASCRIDSIFNELTLME
jgi:hypothetical protein